MYTEPIDIIPVILFVGGFTIAAIAIIMRNKKNQMEHKERMYALEKGAPLPESPIMPPKQKNPYLWGFIFIAIGLPLLFGFATYDHDEGAWLFGMVIFLIGVAVLTANLLHRKDVRKGKANGVVPLEGNDTGSGTPL